MNRIKNIAGTALIASIALAPQAFAQETAPETTTEITTTTTVAET